MNEDEAMDIVIKIDEKSIADEWWDMIIEDIGIVMDQYNLMPVHLRMIADIMEADNKCKKKQK